MAKTEAGTDRPEFGDGRRAWAWGALVAHAVFVLAWIAASGWQGPGYHVLSDSISDLYAQGAPAAWLPIVANSLAGLTLLGFAWFALRPALRGAGRPAVLGVTLLSLSVYGIGDLLTPFERLGCRMADPGCTAAEQVSTPGGVLDQVLTGVGLLLLVAAGFVLAAAMRRLDHWRPWTRPVRAASAGLLVLLLATAVSQQAGLGGLFERLLATAGAAGVAALCCGVLHRTRPTATT